MLESKTEGSSSTTVTVDHQQLEQDIKNSTETKLSLMGRDIGDEGAKAVARGLTGHPTIQQVDLSFNKIGPDGARALSTVLPQNKILKKLNLEHNEIFDGCKALLKALETNNTLEELNLSNNNITNNHAIPIAASLARNETLKILNLSHTGIEPSGVEVLQEAAMGKNITIKVESVNNKSSSLTGAMRIPVNIRYSYFQPAPATLAVPAAPALFPLLLKMWHKLKKKKYVQNKFCNL